MQEQNRERVRRFRERQKAIGPTGVKIPGNKRNVTVMHAEAYTEALALYLHTYYYAKVTNQDFYILLKNEISYSKSKYYLILNHYNINQPLDILSLCQKTNVISYYIIKYLIIKDQIIYKKLLNKENVYNTLTNIIDKFFYT